MTPQLLGLPQLIGLGAEGTTPTDAFLLQFPKPSSTNVASFLQAFSPAERPAVAQQLIAKGVASSTVASALNWLDTSSKWTRYKPQILGALAIASMAASAFHGYRRNKSVGWALVWAIAGGIAPIVTPVIAVAQGFAKPSAS